MDGIQKNGNERQFPNLTTERGSRNFQQGWRNVTEGLSHGERPRIFSVEEIESSRVSPLTQLCLRQILIPIVERFSISFQNSISQKISTIEKFAQLPEFKDNVAELIKLRRDPIDVTALICRSIRSSFCRLPRSLQARLIQHFPSNLVELPTEKDFNEARSPEALGEKMTQLILYIIRSVLQVARYWASSFKNADLIDDQVVLAVPLIKIGRFETLKVRGHPDGEGNSEIQKLVVVTQTRASNLPSLLEFKRWMQICSRMVHKMPQELTDGMLMISRNTTALFTPLWAEHMGGCFSFLVKWHDQAYANIRMMVNQMENILPHARGTFPVRINSQEIKFNLDIREQLLIEGYLFEEKCNRSFFVEECIRPLIIEYNEICSDINGVCGLVAKVMSPRGIPAQEISEKKREIFFECSTDKRKKIVKMLELLGFRLDEFMLPGRST